VRRIRNFLVVLVISFALVVTLPMGGSFVALDTLIGVTPADAQTTKKKRRSLFNILFGRKKAKRKNVKVRKKSRRSVAKKKTRKRKTRKTASRRKSVAAAPAVAAVDKLEDAKTVLVVGDFLAGGLADGLEKRLADVASVVVVDKSRGLSGFVRDDVIDWPAVLPGLIAETKPAYIVAMLGTNDRQQMRVNGKRINKRLPEWDAAYTKRTQYLGAVLKASGLPYTWVGLPPVRFKSMNKDFLVFNEIYAKAAESERGSFVDIWDGFSDADGNYSRSGPDVNGQIVLLRPKGGINLTKAGKERLAFYAEAPILRALGGRANTATAFVPDLDFSTSLPQKAAYDPQKSGKTVVVRLNDPAVDGDQVLAGEKIDRSNATGPSLSVPVLNTAAPTPRREGRVDNYVWPPVGANPIAGATPPVALSN